ncbi:unnamed protein product [Prunus armeniaca]
MEESLTTMWLGMSHPSGDWANQHAQQNPQYSCACKKSYACRLPCQGSTITPRQGYPGSDHIQVSISMYQFPCIRIQDEDELSNRKTKLTNTYSRILNTRTLVTSSTRADYPAKGLWYTPSRVLGFRHIQTISTISKYPSIPRSVAKEAQTPENPTSHVSIPFLYF